MVNRTRNTALAGTLALGTLSCGSRVDLGEIQNHVEGEAGYAVAFAPGPFALCGLTSEKAVVCWKSGQPNALWRASEIGLVDRLEGSNNGQGSLCAIRPGGLLACRDLRSSVPLAPVESIGRVSDVSVGIRGGCALSDAGELRCWGSGAPGFESSGPVPETYQVMPLPRPAVQVAYGDAHVVDMHVCAVLEDGRVFCHGTNAFGVVDGMPNDGRLPPHVLLEPTPVELSGISDAKKVAVTAYTTCVLHQTGRVTCVGHAASVGLGLETHSSSEDRGARGEVPGLEGVVALDSSAYTTCALTESGALYCWGGDFCGSLVSRDGPCEGAEVVVPTSPILLSGFQPARTFGLDDTHICISDFADKVWCRGFLGDYFHERPVAVSAPYRVPL